MKFRFCIVLFLCWIVSSCATWYQRTAAFQDAVSKGELDTNKIPRLYKEIKGNNDFLDLLIQSSLEDEEESED